MKTPKLLVFAKGFFDETSARDPKHEVAIAFREDKNINLAREVWLRETPIRTSEEIDRLIRWLAKARDWLDDRS